MRSDAENSSVISRKLALARDEKVGSTRSILRALRLSLARVAAETVGLAMAVIGATQTRRDQENLSDGLATDRMYLFLTGPGDVLAAVGFDHVCVAAMIQQQTVGGVSDQPVPERPFTNTDAAMVAPFIDALLPRARDLCEVPADRRCLGGLEYASRADSLRKVLLSLEYDRYRVVDLTLEIAGGKHQGHVTLILPDLPECSDPDPEAEDLAAGPRLDESFGVVRADLNAVISRVRLPLSAFAAMRPGDVVPLLEHRLDQTELLTIDGKTVTKARLGQCRGMRALRLNERFPDPEPRTDEPDQFSDHQVQRTTLPTVVNAPSVIGQSDAGSRQAPPLSATAPGEDLSGVVQHETGRDELIDQLSPEQAAAEISELAGLDELTEDADRDI